MVFNNAFKVHDHINNKIDYSFFPEERHHRLQGNIQGILQETPSRLNVTNLESPSILGPVGDIRIPEKILTTDGTSISMSGQKYDVPRSFFDDESPLLVGESGFGSPWRVLNNHQNNIGYSLNFNSQRSMGFPHHATSDTDIKSIPNSPPIEIVERNGQIVPAWEPISKAFPGLGTPVKDSTKNSDLHMSGIPGA